MNRKVKAYNNRGKDDIYFPHLETRDVGAEEGGELASAPGALALVTQLVIQHVRLHLHLQSPHFYKDDDILIRFTNFFFPGTYRSGEEDNEKHENIWPVS
jgi:hypothetical protein